MKIEATARAWSDALKAVLPHAASAPGVPVSVAETAA